MLVDPCSNGLRLRIRQRRPYTAIFTLGFAVLVLMCAAHDTKSQWSSSGGNTTTTDKVGVGTTGPSQKLEIVGLNSGPGASGTTADGILRLQPSSTLATFDFGMSSSPTTFAWLQPRSTNNFATNYNLALNPNGGNVGIGTTSPSNLLHVAGGGRFGTSASLYTIVDINRLDAWNNGSASALYLNYNGGNTLINTMGGNVGIGKSNPTVALDVVGSVNLTGTINAKYQDVAEWVPSSERLPAGTVVVLDATKSNQVTSSTVSYDTRVAGVVSEQPGIALGEKSEAKVLVATTGRVRVKVDATKGPIHIGDLLVTSDIPGVAMKSEPVNLSGVQIHRPGTLVGKALEPLEKGKGEILVLLSLQ